MASDLHAAAELILNFDDIDRADSPEAYRRAAEAVATFVARLTDPTPLTRETFERLGEPVAWRIYRIGRLVAMGPSSEGHFVFTLENFDRPAASLPDFRTLGELRMACHVLGIELKEDGK